MTTLADIETAANALSDAEKQELLLFLAASLRRVSAVVALCVDFISSITPA